LQFARGFGSSESTGRMVSFIAFWKENRNLRFYNIAGFPFAFYCTFVASKIGILVYGIVRFPVAFCELFLDQRMGKSNSLNSWNFHSIFKRFVSSKIRNWIHKTDHSRLLLSLLFCKIGIQQKAEILASKFGNLIL
jgi:hypothetical protein